MPLCGVYGVHPPRRGSQTHRRSHASERSRRTALFRNQRMTRTRAPPSATRGHRRRAGAHSQRPRCNEVALMATARHIQADNIDGVANLEAPSSGMPPRLGPSLCKLRLIASCGTSATNSPRCNSVMRAASKVLPWSLSAALPRPAWQGLHMRMPRALLQVLQRRMPLMRMPQLLRPLLLHRRRSHPAPSRRRPANSARTPGRHRARTCSNGRSKGMSRADLSPRRDHTKPAPRSRAPWDFP